MFQVSVLERVDPIGTDQEKRRRSTQPPLLCVASTHLYWEPTFGQIRLYQTHVSLMHLQRLILHYKEQVRSRQFHPSLLNLKVGCSHTLVARRTFQELILVPRPHAYWNDSLLHVLYSKSKLTSTNPAEVP